MIQRLAAAVRVIDLAGARAFVLLALLAAIAAWPRLAMATPSYDACTGFLEFDGDTGAVAATPGTWCMDEDVVTATNSGTFALVMIEADDVTIDCKGHRLRWT